jgi:isoleucyl-tRNA synthetase
LELNHNFTFIKIVLSQEAPAYGADVLRLWVSSVDYTGDVMIGPQILRQISEIYRKLRGTLRYLLANLHDWKVSSSPEAELNPF